MTGSNSHNNSKLVAIVVAHFDRPYLTDSEEISLTHLRHYLNDYDKFILIPDELNFALDGFTSTRFDKKYFGSAEAHKGLLFSKEYYQRFTDYQYILSYHFDALVFSDQLKNWCAKDYDFIGPPWIKHQDAPYHGTRFEGKVGNGGFSLKKVSSFLKILNSKAYATTANEYWSRYHSHKSIAHRILNWPKKALMSTRHFNNVRWELNHWKWNDDLFFAERASHYYPDFKLAPLDEALKFGFEAVPKYCYEINGNKLPFGCHAWERYDRQFWEPYLLK